MEPMEAFPEGEWDFYSRIFSMEGPDFAAEVLGQCSFPFEQFEGSECSIPSVLHSNPETNYASAAEGGESFFHWGNAFSPNFHVASQDNATKNNNCSTRVLVPTSCHESFLSSDFNSAIPVSSDLSMSMDFSIMDELSTGLFSQLFMDIPVGETAYVSDHLVGNYNVSLNSSCAAPGNDVQLRRKFHAPESKTSQMNHAKKRPRIASDAQNKKKNAKSKKNNKSTTPPSGNDEEEINPGLDGQSLSNYSSEDDNASRDSNGGVSSESKTSEALNSSGKARASRGSATDPQSLYARKRRQRINERLRILQNLVPNGTKVDISTMLEEAVHYVKFLQLQIKLLSSDDLWMFAPIAYNGIDIGVNQKISMLL